jgi:hypothetical protein
MAPEHIALVCIHGHVVSGTIRYTAEDDMGPFCPTCGAPVITDCQGCSAAIPGCDPMWLGAWSPAAFCLQCGVAYPWTEERLAAARESIDLLEGLNDKERQELRSSLDVLIVDVPRTQVAALKAKLLIAKARGPAVATLTDTIRSFAVAAAIKTLFP